MHSLLAVNAGDGICISLASGVQYDSTRPREANSLLCAALLYAALLYSALLCSADALKMNSGSFVLSCIASPCIALPVPSICPSVLQSISPVQPIPIFFYPTHYTIFFFPVQSDTIIHPFVHGRWRGGTECGIKVTTMGAALYRLPKKSV